MIEEKELRSIIEQVFKEMNISGMTAEDMPKKNVPEMTECCAADEGYLPDVTAIDIRTQYLVENPQHKEEYAELKYNAP